MKNKKRRVWVKVSATETKTWYYVNNLVRFTQFLNKTYPDWRFMNVYDKISDLQIANFTKYNKPKQHI